MRIRMFSNLRFWLFHRLLKEILGKLFGEVDWCYEEIGKQYALSLSLRFNPFFFFFFFFVELKFSGTRISSRRLKRPVHLFT